MKGMKSISDKDIIYHRALVDAKEHTFDNGKKWKRKPKNRKPIDGKVLTSLCLVWKLMNLSPFLMGFKKWYFYRLFVAEICFKLFNI